VRRRYKKEKKSGLIAGLLCFTGLNYLFGIIYFANSSVFRASEMVRSLFPMIVRPLFIGNPQIRCGSARIINELPALLK
jgi:hypothetical protein